MRLTLDEFIESVQNGRNFRNAYVRFKGFKELYVRYTRRMLGAEIRYPVLDLAVVEATHPGRGAFTKLFEHIRSKYPDTWLYVESVLNDRFSAKLIKMGFVQQGESFSPNFYLPPATRKP